MLHRKKAFFIEEIRKHQIQKYKVHIRKQLLADIYLGSSQQKQQIQGEDQIINENQQQGNVSNESQNPMIEDQINQIITNFKVLIAGQNSESGQLEYSQSIFNSQIRDLRKVFVFGGQTIDFEFIGHIFAFIRSQIEMRQIKIDPNYSDLSVVSEIESMTECRSKLNETMVQVVIEYLNHNGYLTQYYEGSQIWFMRQLYDWLRQIHRKFKKIVSQIKSSDYNQDHLAIQNKIHFLSYPIKEQNSFVQYLKENQLFKREDVHNFLLQLYSPQYIKTIVVLLSSFQTPEKIKIQILTMLNKIGSLNLSQFFHNLIDGEFIGFMKLQMIVRSEYTNIRAKEALTASQKNQIRLLFLCFEMIRNFTNNNICDQFWKQNICQDLKYISSEVRHPELKNKFIQVILSLVYVEYYSTFSYLYDSNMIQWIVNIIWEKIKELNSIMSHQDQPDFILESCFDRLRFFIHIGEFEMNKKQKLTTNPYLMKLKYMNLQNILSQHSQGHSFLSQVFGVCPEQL